MESEVTTVLNRCRDGEGDFVSWKDGAYDGFAARDIEPRDLINMAFASGGRQIKCRPKTRISVVRGLFVKINLHPTLWRVFRNGFKLPRPYRCLAAAVRLGELGVQTPKVFLAARKRRFWRFPVCDVLVTEALASDRVFADRIFTDRSTARDVSAFLHKTAQLLRQLHEGGFEHGDLNLRNIYCLLGANGELLSLGLIDLDGAKLYPEPLNESKRRKEVARLISGLVKVIRANSPHLRLKVADLAGEFAFVYRELTGVDVSGPELNTRISYLLRRKRKA